MQVFAYGSLQPSAAAAGVPQVRTDAWLAPTQTSTDTACCGDAMPGSSSQAKMLDAGLMDGVEGQTNGITSANLSLTASKDRRFGVLEC